MAAVSAPSAAVRLDGEQIAGFHRDGFLRLERIAPPEDVARIRELLDELFARHRELPREHAYELGTSKDLSRAAVIPQVIAPEKLVPELLETEYYRNARAISEQLLGRDCRFQGGHAIYKPPHNRKETPWHQDIPYLYWSSGGHSSRGRAQTHAIPNFTTDIYLDDSTQENGCLWAIPGTHNNGTVDVDKMVAAHGDFRLPGAVPLVARAGDVMFHHVALVHGSPENHAPSRRRTFYIHYLCDETVEDAYFDWPDLMSPEEAMSFWGSVLAQRQVGGLPRPEALRFEATPAGFRPV